MHDMDILSLNERVGHLIMEIFGDSGLIKRVEKLEEIAAKPEAENEQAHLQQILMDKQRAGMLRVKELEIRDNMGERSMLLEKIKDLEIKLRNSHRDLEVEKRAIEVEKAQPRINHEELERRLDSISQILFCAFEVKRKHKLREAMEISAGAIRLLINDIQFPLVNKDIFKPGSRIQEFYDLPAYEVLRSDDDTYYEGYSEYEEDEDDLG